MPKQTDQHTENCITRYNNFLISLFDNSASKARDKAYAQHCFVEDVKFKYACNFPPESLNEIIASQFDHTFRLGKPLHEAYEHLPAQIGFYDELLNDQLDGTASVIFSEEDAAYARCVKLFVRYQGLRNFITFIQQNHPELIATDVDVKNMLQASNVTSKKREALVKRRKSDKKTRLSMEETLSLLKLLRDQNYILKDEYMTNDLAAYAFHLLTGYSQNTLRQDLSKPYYYHAPLSSLQIHLKQLIAQIDVELAGRSDGNTHGFLSRTDEKWFNDFKSDLDHPK